MALAQDFCTSPCSVLEHEHCSVEEKARDLPPQPAGRGAAGPGLTLLTSDPSLLRAWRPGERTGVLGPK